MGSPIAAAAGQTTAQERDPGWVGKLLGWIRRNGWIVVPILALPALIPLFVYGLPDTGDGTLHLERLMLLDHHLRLGTLFPRWIPELFLGYGYPVFNYYGPTTYYLAELLYLAGAGSFVNAVIALYAILLPVAGIGMYLFSADFYDGRDSRTRTGIGLVAATAYMYSPYLLTNIYVRGAIAETGALILIPWIFWSFRRLLTGSEPLPYVLTGALTLGLFSATHTITLIFFPAVLAVYCALLWLRSRRNADESGRKLLWGLVAGAGAMGIGAFFWLPLIGERHFLSDVAYAVSREMVPDHVWTLTNFLNKGWFYLYSDSIPFQLGIVQLILALAGFLLYRKRGAEYWFWGGLTLIGMFGISAWSVPIWLSNDIFLIAQFPWRLLSIITFPLALFQGMLVSLFDRNHLARRIGPIILIVVIIVANVPRYEYEPTPLAESPLRLSTIAQFEADTGSFGASSSREFLPRWADNFTLTPAAQPTSIGDDLEISVHDFSPFGLEATVSTAEETRLRVTDFFFPGWQVLLDGKEQLTTFATTDQGLLSFDVPPGVHDLSIAWRGTDLQSASNFISGLTLLALLILTWFALRGGRRRRWTIVLAITLIALISVKLYDANDRSEFTTVDKIVDGDSGLQLLGYETQVSDAGTLDIFPLWLVRAQTPELNIRWVISTLEGDMFADSVTSPRYNTLRTDTWTSGTIVDDAYEVTLPPGLVDGEYQLQVQVIPAADLSSFAANNDTLFSVGSVALPQIPELQSKPEEPLEVFFGESGQVVLDGYDFSIEKQGLMRENQDINDIPVLQAGDTIAYRLHWRSLAPISENYHGFLHLQNSNQGVLAQKDQLPGPLLSPPKLWNRYVAQPDIYRLKIPDDAPGGLYQPLVGLYHFDNLERLPATQNGLAIGDSVALPPIKVLEKGQVSPQVPLEAQFEGMGTFLGYDFESSEPIRPGSTISLTLYMRSDSAVSRDYTQFVHLHSAEKGMAAQHDGQPAAGTNPTSAWVPGEIIVDSMALPIREDAPAGEYQLRIGFYDALDGAARLPVIDDAGNPLPDAQIILRIVPIEIN